MLYSPRRPSICVGFSFFFMLTFGADPEAVLIEYGKVVCAGDYFSDDYCYGCSLEKAFVKTDGMPWIIEIETPPFTDPVIGTNYIRNALATVRDKGDDLDIIGGSFVGKFPIGGHIHFSGIDPSSVFLSLLDMVIGRLSLLVSPGQYKRFRYSDEEYGRLGNHRTNSHGFEYRTPPSWLISQEWCLAYLDLAYLAAHAFERDGDILHARIARFSGSGRSKMTKILDHFERYYSEFYHPSHLSPIRRVLKEKGNWGEIPVGSNAYSKYACLKRWNL